MILTMPLLARMAWTLFKNAYQQLTIVLLIRIFFLIPERQLKEKKGSSSDASNQ